MYKQSRYPMYCLGGGYLMSHDVLGKVVKKSYGHMIFPMEDVYVGLMVKDIGIEPVDERKHFNLIYSDQTHDLCKMNSLFLAHQVLGSKNLIKHIRAAHLALEQC